MYGLKVAPKCSKEAIQDASPGEILYGNGLCSGSCCPFKRGSSGDDHANAIPHVKDAIFAKKTKIE